MRIQNIIISGVILYIMGCSPALKKSELKVPERFIYNQNQADTASKVYDKWWCFFGDTTLNNLVEAAIENNKDLAATYSNVEAARSYLAIAKSKYLPSLYFDVEAEVYKTNGIKTKEFTATPAISWEVSLFGALRNTRKDAKAALLAKEWNYKGVMLSLTAQVATAYFNLLQYKRNYDIACQSYILRKDATALIDSLYHYGMSNGIALEQAKSLVYSANSDIYMYKRAVEQTYLALNLLMGQIPQKKLDIICKTLTNTEPTTKEIPAGVPSEVLKRRPDIMESYYNMEQGAAKVGVARASRFPTITLTGDGGLVTATLKDLSSVKPFGWSVAGQLTQPIFSFGRNKRQEQMARHEYNGLVSKYEHTILTALSEVETALVELANYKEEVKMAKKLVMANKKIEKTTWALYKSGMGDYLSVIDAERELYSSQIGLIETQTNQQINYINLFKSLGGGL